MGIQDVLEKLEKEDSEQREKNLPKEVRNRSLTRDSGKFLAMLCRMVNAKIIVEIGTSVGYSTIWLAMAAKSTGGMVITYDIDPKKVEKARDNLQEAKLDGVVTFILGDVSDLPETINLAFFDQEKKDYLRHFKLLFPHIRKGGVIVADNVISHQEELQDYIGHVRSRPECNSIQIPLGKGLEVTYRLRKDELDAFWQEPLIISGRKSSQTFPNAFFQTKLCILELDKQADY